MAFRFESSTFPDHWSVYEDNLYIGTVTRGRYEGKTFWTGAEPVQAYGNRGRAKAHQFHGAIEVMGTDRNHVANKLSALYKSRTNEMPAVLRDLENKLKEASKKGPADDS